MGGGGADLNYTDDDLDSYETIWDGEVTKTAKADHKRVVTALKNISQGNDLEAYMDIDNLLRYMAVHVFSVNEDSLSGSMAHNYYLYESGGRLNLIPWDYNLALGGMGRSNDATDVVNSAIDNAFSSTAFFDTLMEDEAYHAQYYAYLQQLVSEYIDGGGFDAFYVRVRSQIDALVETDPTAFYSYDEYLAAVDTLYQVVKLRGESIQGQLGGTIPSTEAEQRGSGALVDASALDLSVMGYMNNGGGRVDAQLQAVPAVTAEESDTEQGSTEQTGESAPQSGGAGRKAPDDMLQAAEGVQDRNGSNFGNRPSMDDVPNSPDSGPEGTSQTAYTENLMLYGIALLTMAAAMLVAVLYRRRPRRQ